MEENMKNETNKKFREFKSEIMHLTGKCSAKRVEMQLDLLEDIIMVFLTPYTRQLLIDRIIERCKEEECQVCGVSSEEDWIFCMNCGTQLRMIKDPNEPIIEEEDVDSAVKVLAYAKGHNISVEEAMLELGLKEKHKEEYENIKDGKG